MTLSRRGHRQSGRWESRVLANPGAEVPSAQSELELRVAPSGTALIGRRDEDTGQNKDETI